MWGWERFFIAHQRLKEKQNKTKQQTSILPCLVTPMWDEYDSTGGACHGLSRCQFLLPPCLPMHLRLSATSG